MHDDRELNIDELSAVNGGTASTGNGSLPHPKPSPVDQLIKWILNALQ
jgi:bacteriocin-like protein